MNYKDSERHHWSLKSSQCTKTSFKPITQSSKICESQLGKKNQIIKCSSTE